MHRPCGGADRTDEFRTVFYFRDLSQGHGVLIKVCALSACRILTVQDKSLVFPSGSGLQSVPLSQEEAADKANAPVPERTPKRRRMARPAAAPSAPVPEDVKEERQEPESQVVPESDQEAATSPASAHGERESPDEDEQKYKPHVRVRYSGLNLFAKELVLVIEPSERAVAANPGLFVVEDDDASKQERRQLQSTPSAARAWDSVKAEPGEEDGATPRQYGRGLRPETPRPDVRQSPDPRRSQTPLFRGLTPASEDGYP